MPEDPSTPGISANPTTEVEWTTRLHRELRGMAAGLLSRQPPGQTLSATALVHEAWLKLGGDDQQRWQGRAHFFCAAAQSMRQILVDQARRKAARRHGGGQERVALSESQIVSGAPEEEILAVHEVLDRFASHDPAKAELVKLRFFVGLSMAEAAEVLGISKATADRSWAYARAWMFRQIERG